MILLPIGHERQTVQRLPWVTFTLIGICVIVYIYTGFFAQIDDTNLEAKAKEIETYITEHPYLEIPVEVVPLLPASFKEDIDVANESVDRTLLNATEVEKEQRQLNDMAYELLDILNSNPLRRWGYVPNDPHFSNLITCMFVHEGFLHILGNMLFLFLAGCAIEDLWGRPLYLGFYLLSGITATLAHQWRFPDSAIPIIGASGAVAGIMGAFLVRLATTRIRFFYLFFLFTIKTGTFEAPAFIMLPLWFLQQILYAVLTDESAGVAFWAHIGGFSFGAAFAFAMSALRVEEKYIAPSIQKKVMIVQNPMFLQAIELSEKNNFPQALVLLQKVVRQEPNNVDAYLEIRNIVERSMDAEGYTKACAGLLDAAMRSRDEEMLSAHLVHYRQSDLARPLPPKTLLGLGAFYEGNGDDHAAVGIYEEVLRTHQDDPLAMKAASKLARLCIEKLSDREKGEAAFWTAYQHPLANEEWRKALQLEMKRYQINPDSAPQEQVAPPEPVPVYTEPVMAAYEPSDAFSEPEEPVAEVVAPPPPLPPSPAGVQPAGTIPSTEFDGTYSEWTVVACSLGKIGMKGLHLQNTKGITGMLPWKKIRFVSAGRIRTLGGGRPGARESLVLDLVAIAPNNSILLYRTTGKAIDFQRIFPGVQQTFFDAYENFLGILLGNSGAHCVPDRELCTGPVFTEYPDMMSYERRLRDEISKHGQPA